MQNALDKSTEAAVENYIARILKESTPDKPLWNIESIKHNKKPAWNYIDGCMLTGLMSLYNETKDNKFLDFCEKFADYYVLSDGSILGYNLSEYNIDNISAGRVLFDLYAIFKKEKYKKAIELLYSQLKTHPRIDSGNFWHKKIYPGQVWLDGLYMAQVFYTRYETEFNSCKNYDDILSQFKNVRNNMFDQEKKLYYHGWDSTKKMFWANTETGLSSNFWLRAIGWYTAALADVLSYLDDKHTKIFDELKLILQETIDGILKYLDKETNMLYQVVDKASEKGNYPETSGSALIAYAILKAVRINAVPSKYLQAGQDIFNGICKKYLWEKDGNLHLGGICLVAGLGPENNLRRDGSYAYYISEPIVEDDAKGLGPFLVAYSEMKKIK